jgi:hypothetical protein
MTPFDAPHSGHVIDFTAFQCPVFDLSRFDSFCRILTRVDSSCHTNRRTGHAIGPNCVRCNMGGAVFDVWPTS